MRLVTGNVNLTMNRSTSILYPASEVYGSESKAELFVTKSSKDSGSSMKYVVCGDVLHLVSVHVSFEYLQRIGYKL